MVPDIGSLWVWEIDKPRARAIIEVIALKPGWVQTRTLPEAPDPMFAEQKQPAEHWNELDRFCEAASPVGSAE